MKDRMNMERIVELLVIARNTMAEDPRCRENVREINEVISELKKILAENASAKNDQTDKEIIRIVRLAISILSLFF